MWGGLFRMQPLSFPTSKVHSKLQSSKRQFQSSCRLGWCAILRKLLQKISIFGKHMQLMLPASFMLLNHPKSWHTNIAMCLCQWLHRSEGQMISQLHGYPVCTYNKLSWKPSPTNKVKQTIYRRKITRWSCSLHHWSVLNTAVRCRVIFSHVTNNNQGYFSLYRFFHEKPLSALHPKILYVLTSTLRKGSQKPLMNL